MDVYLRESLGSDPTGGFTALAGAEKWERQGIGRSLDIPWDPPSLSGHTGAMISRMVRKGRDIMF